MPTSIIQGENDNNDEETEEDDIRRGIEEEQQQQLEVAENSETSAEEACPIAKALSAAVPATVQPKISFIFQENFVDQQLFFYFSISLANFQSLVCLFYRYSSLG